MRSRILLIAIGACIAAGAILVAGGCGSSSSGSAATSTGRVAILLTDQAGDFQHVLVTVQSVQVHSPGTGWVTVADQHDMDGFITQPVDLLSLQNLEKLIGVGTIPACTYTQLRLVLAPDAQVVLASGETRSLKIPSGEQTGLKTPAFTVPAGEVVYLLVDIKANQIVERGGPNDGFLLPPTAITVTVFTGPFGSLQGTVAPANSAAVVTAFFAGTNVPVAQMTIKTDGTYEIPNLLAGSYYVTASADGFEPFDSQPTLFAVTAGAETVVPLITLTPVPKT
jgi:hypothetical protein